MLPLKLTIIFQSCVIGEETIPEKRDASELAGWTYALDGLNFLGSFSEVLTRTENLRKRKQYYKEVI